MILIFLPAFTIGFTIWADDYSTHSVISPFRAVNGQNITPDASMKNNNMESNRFQITIENGFGLASGFLTFLICIGCFIFQKRTSDALKKFEENLKNETDSNNSEEELNPKLEESAINQVILSSENDETNVENYKQKK